MPNGTDRTAAHRALAAYSASTLSLCLSGCLDPDAEPLDRVTWAGKALGLLGHRVRLEGVWASGPVHLDAVRFVLEGSAPVTLTFGEALAEIDADLAATAHLAGLRCDADRCVRCDERESLAVSAERDRRRELADGAGDWEHDCRRDDELTGARSARIVR